MPEAESQVEVVPEAESQVEGPMEDSAEEEVWSQVQVFDPETVFSGDGAKRRRITGKQPYTE